MIIVGQEVEANGGLFQEEKIDLLACLLEALDVSQLPVLNEVEASHDD